MAHELPAPGPVSDRRCPQCEAVVREGDRVCPACGAPLPDEELPSGSPTPR